MTLQEFVDQVKRDAKIGTYGTNTDQAAIDIISKLNRRMYRVWRKWDWEWGRVAIDFTLSAGTKDKTLDSTVGRVVILGVKNKTDYLKKFTEKRYREWIKKKDIDAEQGTVIGYLYHGLDSSKNIQLRFVHTPSADTDIEGHGQKRITTYTNSQIASAGEIAYFPPEMHGILFHFVLGDALKPIDYDKSVSEIQFAENELQALITEDESDPAEEITASPPDHIIYAVRNRGKGGTTVA